MHGTQYLSLRQRNLIVFMLFAIAFAKGLRFPGLWATTQMLLHYEFGFIRRGLFGTVLFGVFGARAGDYYLLAGIAFLVLIVAAILCARLVRRFLSHERLDPVTTLVVLVVAASPGCVWFLHQIGYFDYFGLIAVMGLIVLSRRTPGRFLIFPVGLVVFLALTFVHENLVVLFGPAMVFVFCTHIGAAAHSESRPISRRRLMLFLGAAAATCLIILGASAAIGALGTKGPDVVARLGESLAKSAGFPVRYDVLSLLSRPPTENALSLMPAHWSDAIHRRYLINGLFASLPSLAFLAYFGWKQIAAASIGTLERRVFFLLLIAAMIGPLLMNLLGWDSARWSADATLAGFTCIMAFRILYSRSGSREPATVELGSWGVTAAICIIVLGLCTDYPGFLFDRYTVRWYPFDGTWDTIINVYKGVITPY